MKCETFNVRAEVIFFTHVYINVDYSSLYLNEMYMTNEKYGCLNEINNLDLFLTMPCNT